jgi:hypothetical protein
MSETAACTVKGYNALRSAAVRSASMSMVHATTTCASSLDGATRAMDYFTAADGWLLKKTRA